MQLEYATSGMNDTRSMPDGLRKLNATPTCEVCRRERTVEVRSVGGVVKALCRGCSRTALPARAAFVPPVRPMLRASRPLVTPAVSAGRNSVARARLALLEVE